TRAQRAPKSCTRRMKPLHRPASIACMTCRVLWRSCSRPWRDEAPGCGGVRPGAFIMLAVASFLQLHTALGGALLHRLAMRGARFLARDRILDREEQRAITGDFRLGHQLVADNA